MINLVWPKVFIVDLDKNLLQGVKHVGLFGKTGNVTDVHPSDGVVLLLQWLQKNINHTIIDMYWVFFWLDWENNGQNLIMIYI